MQLTDATTTTEPPALWRRALNNWGWPVLLILSVVILTVVVARSSIDLDAIRVAARQGTLDALANQAVQAAPSGSSNPVATGAAQPVASQPTSPVSLAVRAANRLGRADAPVTIVEFSDFQCPYCSKFAQETQADLIKQYVDTGQVAFVYKHLALLGDESTWAAEAAECAADQGQFWAYHDQLFQQQAGENQGAFTKDKLLDLARHLNLDMVRFEPCLTNDETLARVQADIQEGQGADVRGTPTFFVNGQPLIGAQPLAAFQAAIAKARAQ